MKKYFLLLLIAICSLTAEAQIIGQPRWQKDFIDVMLRATTDGVTQPSYGQKVKCSGLIARHIRSGKWATLDVYYNFRHDGAESFNYYNWQTASANKITKVGTSTFTANTKVQFASGGYYNTNWQPQTGPLFTQNSSATHVGIVNTGSGYAYGVNVAGAGYTFCISNNIRMHCNDLSGVVPTSGNIASGTKLTVRRLNSTQIRFNTNGVADGTFTQNAEGFSLPNLSMFLGGRNNNGVADATATVGLSFFGAGNQTGDVIESQAYADEVAFESSL